MMLYFAGGLIVNGFLGPRIRIGWRVSRRGDGVGTDGYCRGGELM